jgi:hypothetical protein
MTPVVVLDALISRYHQHERLFAKTNAKDRHTVRFADLVYVLHAFQRKTKSGIKTDQTDVKLIAERLKRAQIDYESRGTS